VPLGRRPWTAFPAEAPRSLPCYRPPSTTEPAQRQPTTPSIFAAWKRLLCIIIFKNLYILIFRPVLCEWNGDRLCREISHLIRFWLPSPTKQKSPALAGFLRSPGGFLEKKPGACRAPPLPSKSAEFVSADGF